MHPLVDIALCVVGSVVLAASAFGYVVNSGPRDTVPIQVYAWGAFGLAALVGGILSAIF